MTIIGTAYRVICSLAPNWTRSASNRFTENGAKKMVEQADRTCPGKHTIEPIS